MKAPPISERDFMRQITDLAELRGFEWVHCRAGRTVDSWRTPMSGTMAKGWPDLVLCRNRRLLFIEVKRDAGKTTPEQDRVLQRLGLAAETYVLRPVDWSWIERELR